MPHLSPPTLTVSEQRAILQATVGNARDHLVYSLALGTGLRLAEIVGLNVGDVFFPDGRPRNRVRIRREIAKGGRVGIPRTRLELRHQPLHTVARSVRESRLTEDRGCSFPEARVICQEECSAQVIDRQQGVLLELVR